MALSSLIEYVQALDTSATDGSGKTALAFGDITAKYLTQAGTLTSLTTETITTLGTYQAPTSAAHIRIKELANTDPTKGIYEVHFHDTQLAAAGKRLKLFLSATGARFIPLHVDLLAHDVQSLGTSTQSLTDLKDFADTGYDPATHKVADTALLAGSATVVLTDASLTTAKLGTFALAKTTNITGFNDITAAAVEAAILNEGDATALLAAIAAKVEEFLINDGDATATIAAIATACNAAVVAGTVGSNVASILADTNELQTDWANGGRLDLLLDAVFADTDSLDTTKLTTARAAVLTDWIDGGRLDVILGARASQTSVDAISAVAIADAVWDEILSGHAIAGSTGAGLSSAGAAGDPLSSAVPGAYAAGTAGFALGEVAAVRVLGPLDSVVASVGGITAGTKIVAYHYAPVEVGPISVLDADGEPLDMSSYATDLAFIVFSWDGQAETLIAQLNYPNVVVGGAGNNQITLANTTTLTGTVGRLLYGVRRRTANTKFVRAEGEFIVKPMANVTSP